MRNRDIEDQVRELLEGLRMTWALDAMADSLPVDGPKRVAALKCMEKMLAAETRKRRERRIARRIAESKLPEYPTLAGFDFDFQPDLDKDLVMELATLAWVDRKEDLVFFGRSGTGKSHIAKALCMIGCSQERRVRYATCADMLADLFASLADGSLNRALARYTRPPLLLIDDLGYDPIEQEQAREAQLLYKVLEARHGKTSTIITSNLFADDWADYLGNHYLTAALLDRLLYRAIAITIDGPSFRLEEHKKRQAARQTKKPAKKKPAKKKATSKRKKP
jgi:DNA replication protein DnaC